MATRKKWRQLNNSNLIRFLLLFISGWALIQLIAYFYTVISIFTISATFAALLNFPVRWLTRYLPRAWAIAVTCLTVLTLAIGFVTLLGLEIVNQGQGLTASLFDFVQNTDLKPVREVLKGVDVSKFITTLQTGLLSGVGLVQGTFSNFLLLIFVVVICIYMLIDGNRIWATCLKVIPESQRDRVGTVFQKSFVGFFRAQFLLIAFLSFLGFVAFTILGVNYALFLALILAVIDAIPGIGGTLCAIVVTVLVFLSQGPWMALKVLITCTVLQQIQDNLISPKLMKENLNINPVLLFFALFIGERVAGLLGVFLSIPIAGMIVSLMAKPRDYLEAESPESLQQPHDQQ